MAKKQQNADERSRDDSPESGETVMEEEHLYENWDELSADAEEVSRLGKALEGLLPDIVKRGLGGLVSEDGIRSVVTDKRLPREAASFIATQVDATKREALRIVSKEVRLFLENVDLGGELTKILTSVSFEVRTQVRFVPNDAAVKPSVRNKVSVKRERGDNEGVEEEGAGESEEERTRARGGRRWSRLRGRGSDEREERDEPSDQEDA
ncbi:hypothetical protein EA187_04340 [Lujinxingia sediminis]|uniref:DUF2267 domain-containing protein n=1 Tax=Lujinxingia sediminis TaxID=2480984 RepID=A0ABY0CXP7_9DELT|nr:hypothetical protein [Lujinxingia sediminis]RVU48667.1 hypothetical protein EA187_04340 [Lujinxingia sediminis]